jgi:uncharacterized lipoprotein YajG
MIRLLPALPALLLLAACSASPQTARAPARPATPADSPEAAGCRAEARASVNTREAARQVNFNNPNQMDRVRQMEADAESRAFTDCMRRLGLIRGGGVEPVRRPGMGF